MLQQERNPCPAYENDQNTAPTFCSGAPLRTFKAMREADPSQSLHGEAMARALVHGYLLCGRWERASWKNQEGNIALRLPGKFLGKRYGGRVK